MEQTTIALSLGKADVQQGVAAVLEQLATQPLQLDEHTQQEIIAYNMGMSILFETLRSTF